MKMEARLANEHDLDYLFYKIQADLDEQGVLHRFKYDKDSFKKAIFSQEPIAYFLVLLIDEKQVGFANFSIDNRNFTANYLPNLYLNDIYIDKEYRRKGGATFLFNELKEIAKEKNCGRIEWLVQKNNIQALEFYDTLTKAKKIDSLDYMRLEIDK